MFDDDFVIHPLKTKKDREIPSSGIFFVNPGEAHRALAETIKHGGRELFLHNSRLAVTQDGSRFVAGPAIGAPAAVLVMEKLIVLGAKQITLMGWCGAIDPDFAIGDIVVPVGAVCGEGTSRYYSDEKRPRPSRAGCEVLFKLLSAEKLDWKEGIVWSTDAPYRESRTLLRRLHDEEQVIGVDMEFSALCSVASYRKIDFSAVLMVSDEVWSSTWKPGFKDKMFQERCRRLLDGLLHNFS